MEPFPHKYIRFLNFNCIKRNYAHNFPKFDTPFTILNSSSSINLQVNTKLFICFSVRQRFKNNAFFDLRSLYNLIKLLKY